MALVNSQWIKSTRCGESSHCVEVAAAWTKSSRSVDMNACVEVAGHAEQVLLRDSKNIDAGVLEFDPAVWAQFIAGVKAGDFD